MISTVINNITPANEKQKIKYRSFKNLDVIALNEDLSKVNIQVHIQYWSVDGKYRIYLTRLRNGVKDELLASLSPRFAPSQINSIFTVNRPILYLSCNPRCPKK